MRSLEGDFALQEKRSWNVENLSLLGFFFYGCECGLTTLVVSYHVSPIQRSRGPEKRTVLFGWVFVMAVYAPDSGKNLEAYENFVEEKTTIVVEGHRAGPNASTSQVISTSS